MRCHVYNSPIFNPDQYNLKKHGREKPAQTDANAHLLLRAPQFFE